MRELAVRLRSHLQESFTTERAGRPVLAVKASSRSAVPGIVHDSSGSGETIFVEPMAVVEANNEARELQAREQQEQERILQMLSRLLGEEARVLGDVTEALARLDLALACGALSRAWRGCPVEPAGQVELRGARHPLLDPATAVPIDLPLEGIRALVVSGPNTGGKTVALKTLGLLAMLHQCGLRVPADRARMPVFDRVLADIGDDQSIAESLSTFSAHVRRLVAIMAATGRRSLVLLDEPAAGTDPDEGARLAQAVIARLVDQGALVVATTHHPGVKAWASAAEGAANAAVGVDVRALRPLYALSFGEPGASHALGIAERLGLDPEVVEAARAAGPPERRAMEALLDEAAADARRRGGGARRRRRRAGGRRGGGARRPRPAGGAGPAHRPLERGGGGRAPQGPRAGGGRAARAHPRADRAARGHRRRPPRGGGAGRVDDRRRPGARARPRPPPGRGVGGGRPGPRGPRPAARRAGRRRADRRGRRGRRPGDGLPRHGGVHRGRPRRGAGRRRADAAPPRPPAPRRAGVAAPSRSRRRWWRRRRAARRRRSRWTSGGAAPTRRARRSASASTRPRWRGCRPVRVIHGHGTGALRAAVRDELGRHPLVAHAEPAPPDQGGDGATIAHLAG